MVPFSFDQHAPKNTQDGNDIHLVRACCSCSNLPQPVHLPPVALHNKELVLNVLWDFHHALADFFGKNYRVFFVAVHNDNVHISGYAATLFRGIISIAVQLGY